jgi:spore maturation protein CgeB
VLLVGPADETMHAHTRLRRRALERIGCRVSAIDPHRSGGWLGRFRKTGLQDRLAKAMASAAPGVVVVIEDRRLDPALVDWLKQGSGATWAGWFCDSFRAPERVRPLAAAYDLVLIADSEAASTLAGDSPAPVRYLPPGCDPSIHRPMRSRDQFRANVVFAGTATPHRERLLWELIEFGLAVWGPGWRRTKLRDYCRGELLAHEDYVRAYAGASVAINLSCGGESEASEGPGCNRRLFELAAIGVPQVVEECSDLHRHFREGSEVLVSRTAADLRRLTAEALHDRAWAEQVAAGARHRALTEHTYMHRMIELLHLSGGLTQAVR